MMYSNEKREDEVYFACELGRFAFTNPPIHLIPYTIHKSATIPRNKFVFLSLRDCVFSEIWAFCQIISLGSGATHTSKTSGFDVKGALAAVVREVRSRNVTNPVDDILDPRRTPSTALSSK